MKTWDVFHARNLSREQMQNSRELKTLEPAYKQFKAFRSEIIEAAISIESLIDALLVRLFAGKNADQARLFEELVLDVNRCTFSQKCRMLHRALDVKGTPQDELIKDIEKLIAATNRFAHGALCVQ